MSGPSYKTPEVLCPRCGAAVDGATGVGHEQSPKGGDLSVCLYCGSINEFTTELQLAELSAGAIAELAPDVRRLVLRASAAAKSLHVTAPRPRTSA